MKKVYLVGGAVRDLLLGIEPKDQDYVVTGSTEEEMLALGYEKVGADFPVFLHPETREEYALARRERKTGPGYHGFQCEFGPDVTIEEDLSRRDLSINAMAMDMMGNLIDPYSGQADLHPIKLRHVSDAFSEDPVRVLRLARFFARYEWSTIDEDTMELARKIVKSADFAEIKVERIWKEIYKALDDTDGSSFFHCLFEFGVFGGDCKHPFFRSKAFGHTNYGFLSSVGPRLHLLHGMKSKVNPNIRLAMILSDVDGEISMESDLVSLLKLRHDILDSRSFDVWSHKHVQNTIEFIMDHRLLHSTDLTALKITMIKIVCRDFHLTSDTFFNVMNAMKEIELKPVTKGGASPRQQIINQYINQITKGKIDVQQQK